MAGTQKDVGACGAVSDELKKEMWDIVVGLQQNLIKKTKDGREVGEGRTNNVSDDSLIGEKRRGKEVETPTAGNLFKKRCISTQATINTIFKKNLREEACEDIASFFYNNAVPFNMARSEE